MGSIDAAPKIHVQSSMWSLTFFVKSNCRSLCCISTHLFRHDLWTPPKGWRCTYYALPNQDHSWHGQGLIREGRNPKIAAHMAIECSIFGLKFHSNFQFDASRLLWSRTRTTASGRLGAEMMSLLKIRKFLKSFFGVIVKVLLSHQ